MCLLTIFSRSLPLCKMFVNCTEKGQKEGFPLQIRGKERQKREVYPVHNYFNISDKAFIAYWNFNVYKKKSCCNCLADLIWQVKHYILIIIMYMWGVCILSCSLYILFLNVHLFSILTFLFLIPCSRSCCSGRILLFVNNTSSILILIKYYQIC